MSRSPKSLKVFGLLLATTLASCSTLSTEDVNLADATGNLKPGAPSDPASGYYLLGKSLLSIEVRRSGNVIFIDEPKITKIADAEHVYQIRTHLSAFSDDHFEIDTNADGTLNKIKTTAVDKTGDIIKTVGSFVITLLTGVPSNLDPGNRALFDQDAPVELRLSFDPSDQGDVIRVNEALRKGGYSLRIEACSLGWEPPHAGTHQSATRQENTPLKRPAVRCDSPPVRDEVSSKIRTGTAPSEVGVVYRPALPWRITVTEGALGLIQSQHVANIENRAPLLSIPLHRSAFVNRVNEITFDKGLPTKVDFNKPSEVLAFVSIPLDILNSVLKSISQIIPLAGANFTAQNTLLEQQKAYYENLLALEKAKADYEASRSGSSGGTGGENNGAGDAGDSDVGDQADL